jgi:hypothetical protein
MTRIPRFCSALSNGALVLYCAASKRSSRFVPVFEFISCLYTFLTCFSIAVTTSQPQREATCRLSICRYENSARKNAHEGSARGLHGQNISCIVLTLCILFPLALCRASIVSLAPLQPFKPEFFGVDAKLPEPEVEAEAEPEPEPSAAAAADGDDQKQDDSAAAAAAPDGEAPAAAAESGSGMRDVLCADA